MESASHPTAQPGEIEKLRTLVPLHTLPDDAFDSIVALVEIQTLEKGGMLFRQGDTDHENIYLLEGSIALLSGERVVEKVESGQSSARFPIAHQLPRKHTARAAGRVRFARVDSRVLSDLLSRSQSVAYQVDDLETADENDWMSMLLQSPVLQLIPASNIQGVMMKVTQEEVSAGDRIIQQGDPGDYYYMLTAGRAEVTRDMGDGGEAESIAELGPGTAFGEEALLSDNPRNSSITMLTDGQVLRLAKEDFVELIQSALTSKLTFDQAREKVEQGAVWLDLRGRELYDEEHLPGAINLPVESLRYQASSLAPDRHYVLYSNSGGRANAAAFLLTERGFDVSILDGGLNALDEKRDQAMSEAPVQEPGADQGELQRRVAEAEQRARELEDRLKEAEAGQQEQETERQAQFESVRDAVEGAKAKLLQTEREKDEALRAQQEAFGEMQRLSEDLDKIESERAELAGQVDAIQGQDHRLQRRLEKAERELIAERERAESASSSLEDLEVRVEALRSERELERDEHARQSGELKEEMTALQLELEQTRMELEELHQADRAADPVPAAAGVVATGGGDDERVVALQRSNEALAAELQRSQQESAALREEFDHLHQQLQSELEESVQARETMLGLEQARDALEKQIKEMRQEQVALQSEHAQLQAFVDEQEATYEEQIKSLQADPAVTPEQLATVQRECEQAKSGLAAKQAEVDELRGVMQQYVDRAGAEGDSAEQVEALQTELAMVREQAANDVAQMRERVRQAETALSDARSSDGEDALSVEAMRQQVEALEVSLAERQKELSEQDANRQLLEDEVEDAHRDIEARQNEIDKMRLETEELQYRLQETEDARQQIQEALYRCQEEAEDAKVADLKDDRLRTGGKALDIDRVSGGGLGSKLLLMAVGAGLVVVILELLAIVSGRGELFSTLLR